MHLAVPTHKALDSDVRYNPCDKHARTATEEIN